MNASTAWAIARRCTAERPRGTRRRLGGGGGGGGGGGFFRRFGGGGDGGGAFRLRLTCLILGGGRGAFRLRLTFGGGDFRLRLDLTGSGDFFRARFSFGGAFFFAAFFFATGFRRLRSRSTSALDVRLPVRLGRAFFRSGFRRAATPLRSGVQDAGSVDDEKSTLHVASRLIPDLRVRERPSDATSTRAEDDYPPS